MGRPAQYPEPSQASLMVQAMPSLHDVPALTLLITQMLPMHRPAVQGFVVAQSLCCWHWHTLTPWHTPLLQRSLAVHELLSSHSCPFTAKTRAGHASVPPVQYCGISQLVLDGWQAAVLGRYWQVCWLQHAPNAANMAVDGFSATSHCSPGSRMPLPQAGANAPVVVPVTLAPMASHAVLVPA